MADPPNCFLHFPESTVYPANFLTAHDTISDVYRHALQTSNHEDADPLRLMFHHDAINNVALPLLEAIGEDPTVTTLDLVGWLASATMALASLSKRLDNFHAESGSR